MHDFMNVNQWKDDEGAIHLMIEISPAALARIDADILAVLSTAVNRLINWMALALVTNADDQIPHG